MRQEDKYWQPVSSEEMMGAEEQSNVAGKNLKDIGSGVIPVADQVQVEKSSNRTSKPTIKVQGLSRGT